MMNAAAQPLPNETVVLVVEDESLIRMMLVDALEDRDYVVLEADGADQAVQILEQQPDVRIVVTDVRMPGSMNGLGLAQWIRDSRRDIKVVVTSGYVSDSEQKSAAAAFDRFIGKPYRLSEVVAVVDALLE